MDYANPNIGWWFLVVMNSTTLIIFINEEYVVSDKRRKKKESLICFQCGDYCNDYFTNVWEMRLLGEMVCLYNCSKNILLYQ